MTVSESKESTERELFNFKDFSSLDTSQDAEYLIASMDELFAIDSIQRIKQHAIDLLSVQEGESILELGCGLGDDAEHLGRLVGSSGKVIAIDSSTLMISKAKERSIHSCVEYIIGDASKLNYPDETFDACHMDRLLVSQRNVHRVLKESIRVLKKGGRISVTDCDFGSIILYPYDDISTSKLIERLQSIVENPFIGRELQPFFKEHGLVDIKIIPEPYLVRSFEKLNTMIDFRRIIADLQYTHVLTPDVARHTLKAMEQADQEGNFLYGITLFTVVGIKA